VELALLKMCHLTSAFNLATTPLNGMPSSEGQLKKKPDAPVNAAPSPVVTPPTPVLSESPTEYTPSKTHVSNVAPAVAVKEATVIEKPKVFIPNLHATATSVKIPSMKELAKGGDTMVEEEEDPYLKGEDHEDFTTDAFLKLWNEYAAKLKTDGKHNVLSIFNANAPVMLKPYEFEVVVGSKVQENLFRNERAYILNFLRSSLKNFSIELNARVDETVAVKRPYTNQEKFQHMAAKNPALVELKKRFNLDFD
jgi:DNA polymerase-3 subunit gamma/tau